MNIYTKTGDKGYTSLVKQQNVSKSDDRIHLLGNLDELTSNIGVVKSFETNEGTKGELERIQRNLMLIMAGVADPTNQDYKLRMDETFHLEEEINRMEGLFPRKKEFILPGACQHSAKIDVARTVIRRTERLMVAVDNRYHLDTEAKKYMNRLADYFYILARYTDHLYENGAQSKLSTSGVKQMSNNQDIVELVMNKLGLGLNRIDLATAKKLIAKIEEQAASRGLNAVIAICNPEGNPVAVHVMDDAFLASFDIAMKKAYTSVAVKMSTKELGELAQPGGMFYGVDKADNGRLMIIGGGIPLSIDGKIIGGLGVSGGSAQEDTALAEYGASQLMELVSSKRQKDEH